MFYFIITIILTVEQQSWWRSITMEDEESRQEMAINHGTKRSWLRTMAAGLESFVPSALACLGSHGTQPWLTLEHRLALGLGWAKNPMGLSCCQHLNAWQRSSMVGLGIQWISAAGKQAFKRRLALEL